MNTPNELLLESLTSHKLLSLYIATLRPKISSIDNYRVIRSPSSQAEPIYINDNITAILYLNSNTKYNITITTNNGINYHFSGEYFVH